MNTLAAQSPLALPLLYINLDEDHVRRSTFEAAFAAAGLAVERLAATRWTRLDPDAQQRLYSAELNRRLQ